MFKWSKLVFFLEVASAQKTYAGKHVHKWLESSIF